MTPRPIPRLRWVVAGLLFLATTVNYIDRQTISVAAPVISKEFGFTAQDYSWIVFSFLLAYAVMQVVAGALVDRVGTRRGFSIAIVGWSIANMLHAFGSAAGVGRASVEDLEKVEGVSQALAQRIHAHFRKS